jgi:hypothetical protein
MHGNDDWPVLPALPPPALTLTVTDGPGTPAAIRAQAAAILYGPACTDPAPESCADAACPVHGDEAIGTWVTCEGCGVLVPYDETCGECGRPL